MSRRHERALDRLREVAKSRGQELREYVPHQPETAPRERSMPKLTKTFSQQGSLPEAKQQTSQDASSSGLNLAQRIVLIICFIVILGMTLFPPWVYIFNPPADLRHRFVRVERPAGYHLLFNDHSPQDLSQLLVLFNLTPDATRVDGYERSMMTLSVFSVQLDKNRLAVQIGAALLLTAILCLAFQSRN
jgi:hypothetical protein